MQWLPRGFFSVLWVKSQLSNWKQYDNYRPHMNPSAPSAGDGERMLCSQNDLAKNPPNACWMVCEGEVFLLNSNRGKFIHFLWIFFCHAVLLRDRKIYTPGLWDAIRRGENVD